MNLNPIMESFYKAMLIYAGLGVNEDGSIFLSESESKKLIEAKDGRIMHLPYEVLLMNPDGKAFFHLLNENYQKPEANAFCIYRHHLLESINTKLLLMIRTLIEIGSDKEVQKLITNFDFSDLIASIGEVSGDQIEVITKVFGKAVGEHGPGCFIDFFLKRNGKIGETYYVAIAKTNHIFYKEIENALTTQSGNYTLFGLKVRKKDLITFKNIMLAIFPDIEAEDNYSVGTDNVVFGFLNALLNVSYTVSSRLNKMIEMMSENIDAGGIGCDLEWVKYLEDLYKLTDVIRLIPNQDNIMVEAANKVTVNESSVKDKNLIQQSQPQVQQTNQPPQFNPTQVPQQQTVQAPVQNQQVSNAPSLEQMLSSGMSGQPMVNPIMQQGMMMQPNMMQGQMYPQQNMMHPQMYPQTNMMQGQMYPQQNMMQNNMGLSGVTNRTPKWAIEMEVNRQMNERQQQIQNQYNAQTNNGNPYLTPNVSTMQPNMMQGQMYPQQNMVMNQFGNQMGVFGQQTYDPFSSINPGGY